MYRLNGEERHGEDAVMFYCFELSQCHRSSCLNGCEAEELEVLAASLLGDIVVCS